MTYRVEWRLIEPLLPNKPRGVARVDDRRVINGIFYVLRTGSPWRDLPDRYGPYDRLQPLQQVGEGRRVVAHLRGAGGQVATVDAFDRQLDHPDTSTPRAKKGPDAHWPFSWRTEHQDPRRRRPGRSAGAVALLSPGQASDLDLTVPQLLAGLPIPATVVADQATTTRRHRPDPSLRRRTQHPEHLAALHPPLRRHRNLPAS